MTRDAENAKPLLALVQGHSFSLLMILARYSPDRVLGRVLGSRRVVVALPYARPPACVESPDRQFCS